MIACCNDGTRPVIFKIERHDYLVVKIDGMKCEKCAAKVKAALESIGGTERVDVRLDKGWVEIFVKHGECPDFDEIINAVDNAGFKVTVIE